MLALLPFVVALAACQTEPWTKPSATAAELRRDLADCERVATGPPPFHFWALNESYEGARERVVARRSACMTGRGWQRATGTAATAAG